MATWLGTGMVACALCLAAAAWASDTHYTFQTIDGTAHKLLGTTVVGINDQGDISGYYVSGSGKALTYHGFIGHGFIGKPTDGQLTEIVRPGSAGTRVTTINNTGTVVGVSTDGAGHAFARTAEGSFVTVDPPVQLFGEAYAEAVGLSNDGAIVGYYTKTVPSSTDDLQTLSHGFLLIGTKYARIDVPPGWGFGTQPYTVNIHHQVVGSYLDYAAVPHGFVYAPGDRMRKLDLPFAAASEPGGGNDRGDIVDTALSPDPASPLGYHADGYVIHAYDPDLGFAARPTITPIAVPGAKSTQPFSINNQGQVVGLYVDADDMIRGFVATPE